MNDKRAYGGNLWMGHRTVRKGGFITWDGSRYQHDELIKYNGSRLLVVFAGKSSFATGPIQIFYTETKSYHPDFALCTIEKPYKP